MGYQNFRLIGDDGDAMAGTFGEPQIGDGLRTMDVMAGGVAASGRGKGFWMIVAKATTGSIFAAFKLGMIFPADGDEIPAVGDSVAFGSFTSFLDIVEWSATISSKKIETGVKNDRFVQYRLGKGEFSGKMKFQIIQGVSDESGGMLRRFFKTVHKNAAGVISVSEPTNEAIWVLLYIRKSDLPGERAEFLFAPIYLAGAGAGGSSGNAQSSDVDFVLGGQDPIFYIEDIPAA
jgi:hypothetical protein